MSFRPYNRPDDPRWRQVEGSDGSPEIIADFINPNKGTPTSPAEGHSIPVKGYGIASGESFVKGALVRLDVSDELTELSVATETVKGVALEEVVNGSSLGPASSTGLIALVEFTDTERTEKTIQPRFAVEDVDDGTLPTSNDIGTKCAIAVSGSGEWGINIDDTASEDVEVLKIDEVRSLYIVRFLGDAIQA